MWFNHLSRNPEEVPSRQRASWALHYPTSGCRDTHMLPKPKAHLLEGTPMCSCRLLSLLLFLPLIWHDLQISFFSPCLHHRPCNGALGHVQSHKLQAAGFWDSASPLSIFCLRFAVCMETPLGFKGQATSQLMFKQRNALNERWSASGDAGTERGHRICSPLFPAPGNVPGLVAVAFH